MKPILVFVDDEAELLEIFAERFERAYAVTIFSSPQALLTEVLQNGLRPDVIVTDMRMGKISGVAMIKTLNESGFMIPALLMSGDASPELKAEAAKTSIRQVLEKPCPDANLSEWISKLMKEKAS